MTLRPGRGNYFGPDEYNVLNVPRFRVYFATASFAFGPGTNYLSWDTIDYDTDGMCSVSASPFVTCRTAGLYHVKGSILWSGLVATQWLWLRVIVNNIATQAVATTTAQGINAGFGTYMEGSGQWLAQAGDTIGLYAFTNAGATINGTKWNSALEGHLVSTI